VLLAALSRRLAQALLEANPHVCRVMIPNGRIERALHKLPPHVHVRERQPDGAGQRVDLVALYD
jgi:hypothetical protein